MRGITPENGAMGGITRGGYWGITTEEGAIGGHTVYCIYLKPSLYLPFSLIILGKPNNRCLKIVII